VVGLESLPAKPEKTRPQPQRIKAQRLLLALWIGAAIQLLGQLVDVRWHATHSSHFRSASEQVEAHWAIWLGIAVMLVASLAMVRSGHGEAGRGPTGALAATSALVVGQVWNFWDHAQGTTTVPPHLLIAFGRLGVLVAAAVATHDLLGRTESPASGFSQATRTKRSSPPRPSA